MWGNVAEAPGKPLSPSGQRLARVLYIHYLSKVMHRSHTDPACFYPQQCTQECEHSKDVPHMRSSISETQCTWG